MKRAIISRRLLRRAEQFFIAATFVTLSVWVSCNMWAETDAARFAVTFTQQTMFSGDMASDGISLLQKLASTVPLVILTGLFVEDFITGILHDRTPVQN